MTHGMVCAPQPEAVEAGALAHCGPTPETLLSAAASERCNRPEDRADPSESDSAQTGPN